MKVSWSLPDLVSYASFVLSIASLIVSALNRGRIDQTRKEILFKSTAGDLVEKLQSFASLISNCYLEFPTKKSDIKHSIKLYMDNLERSMPNMPLAARKKARQMHKKQMLFMRRYSRLGPEAKSELWELFHSGVSVLAAHLEGTLSDYAVGEKYE
jgi:hypothetical protein